MATYKLAQKGVGFYVVKVGASKLTVLPPQQKYINWAYCKCLEDIIDLESYSGKINWQPYLQKYFLKKSLR